PSVSLVTRVQRKRDAPLPRWLSRSRMAPATERRERSTRAVDGRDGDELPHGQGGGGRQGCAPARRNGVHGGAGRSERRAPLPAGAPARRDAQARRRRPAAV